MSSLHPGLRSEALSQKNKIQEKKDLFEANLAYLASSRPAKATVELLGTVYRSPDLAFRVYITTNLSLLCL